MKHEFANCREVSQQKFAGEELAKIIDSSINLFAYMSSDCQHFLLEISFNFPRLPNTRREEVFDKTQNPTQKTKPEQVFGRLGLVVHKLDLF